MINPCHSQFVHTLSQKDRGRAKARENLVHLIEANLLANVDGSGSAMEWRELEIGWQVKKPACNQGATPLFRVPSSLVSKEIISIIRR